jgi:ribosomal protein S18 acetylase RimI-like enzyme
MRQLQFFIIFLFISVLSFGDQIVIGKDGRLIRIAVVRSIEDINFKEGQDLLVRSFMHAYEDVPLEELNKNFRSTGDVRRFYQGYFKEELSHFEHGDLYWTQAFIEDNLVGFATFELEPGESDASYMNLLAVHPDFQGVGIGKALTFSICSRELFPNVNIIRLLIRKINIEGERFYKKIGFTECNYTRDNFVDPALLTGLSWEKK